MAIIASHGQEIDLGNGRKRAFVKIADISTASSLLAKSSTTGHKRRFVGGRISFGAAVGFEIKAPDASAPKLYDKPAGASVWTIDEHLDRVVSDAATDDPESTIGSLLIEGDTATTADGFIDFIEGPDPQASRKR